MKVSIPDKSYFRIGEVSRLLDVKPYVIRYWESEFKTVRPIRTRSDQRLYRHKDVEELLMIRQTSLRGEFHHQRGQKTAPKDAGRGGGWPDGTGGMGSSMRSRKVCA